MASDNTNSLDLLPETDLLELYQERFPGWAVPPIISPSSEVKPSPLRTRLVLALASNQRVLQWQQQYGNLGARDSPDY
jgi:hypothetical protein